MLKLNADFVKYIISKVHPLSLIESDKDMLVVHL